MITRTFRTRLSVLIGGLSAIALIPMVANAVDIGGKTTFEAAPRLLSTYSTHTARSAPTTYFFTIQLPEQAGEPLKALRIEQLENLETVSLRGNKVKASTGKRFAKKSALSTSAIGGPDNPGEITVVFEQPVEPGQTFTVGIVPNYNPNHGGIYQFRVVAFPDGNDAIGLPLGIGRVFVDSD